MAQITFNRSLPTPAGPGRRTLFVSIHGDIQCSELELLFQCRCILRKKQEDGHMQSFRSWWQPSGQAEAAPGLVMTLRMVGQQRSPSNPKFVHKVTGEALSLSCLARAKWVGSRPGTLDVQLHSGLEGPRGSSSVVCSKLGDELQSLCQEGHLDKALDILFRMDQEGTVPSVTMYSFLLKACNRRKGLAQTKQVHAHIAQHGFETSKFLGEYVVSTLVKCGGLEDALQVFHRLPYRTVFSWTAVISGYTMSGQCHEALRVYKRMQQEDVQPNAYTFVSLLRACGSIADLEEGKHIHAEVVKYRCETDFIVQTCLVDMYGKCRSIVDAQKVFNGLAQPDVVAWTALLAAYAEQRDGEKALQVYRQMQEEKVTPNNRTFVSALQACGMLAEREEGAIVDGQIIKMRSLERGKAIHADCWQKGYDSDVFVGNTLVSMYGKCGSIVDALKAFDELSQRNVVAWTAMLMAYLEQDEQEKALQLYRVMRQEGVNADSRTFVTMLQVCGMLAEKEDIVLVARQPVKLKALEKGKAMHADACRNNYDSEVFISSTLVSMYAKCGSILDAQIVFDGLFQRNVVAWTAMLAAYAEQGQAEKALELYEHMRQEGVSPDAWTFVSTFQAYSMLAQKEDVVDAQLVRVKALEKAKVVHADASRKSYDSDVYVGNTLVSMYGKFRSVEDAQYVFDRLSLQSVVSWTGLLTAYVEQGQAEKALQVYEQMCQEGFSSDNRTFVTLLQACCILAEEEGDVILDGTSTKVKSLERAKAIHADAQMRGYSTDVFVGSTLLSMYGKCGSMMDAQTVFDGLSHHDEVSWTALLAGYVDQHQGEKALGLYKEMLQEVESPDDVTVVCILQACSDSGSLAILRQVHGTLVSGRNNLSSFAASALISAYGRCASMVEAQSVFDAFPEPNGILWNALIAGYAKQGNYSASLQNYEEMRLAGIKPDGVTFVSLLSACSHAGLVDKGAEYFESMSKDHGIHPQIDHYVSMIDLFGRAGSFARIDELLSIMPMQPNLDLWLCLLGACQKYGEVELGEKAFNGAVQLQPQHPAAYVLMSNIYADAGLIDRAKDMRKLRQVEGAWKKPGQSWIEQEKSVHTFLVGDREHSQQEELYKLLGEVRLIMKKKKGIPHINRIQSGLG